MPFYVTCKNFTVRSYLCISTDFCEIRYSGLPSHYGHYVYLAALRTWSLPLWNHIIPTRTSEPGSMIVSPACLPSPQRITTKELLKVSGGLLPVSYCFGGESSLWVFHGNECWVLWPYSVHPLSHLHSLSS